MAGGIFEPRLDEDFHDWQPLACYLCKQQFDVPCLLDCLHTFCQSCLAGRAVDGKLACPVCGEETITEACFPPEDNLFLALLKASAIEEVVCANCDVQSAEMMYCNTCEQTMCPECKTHTHNARMFSTHEIVQAPLRVNNKDKKCRLHQESLVLFHKERHLLFCVKCFQDLPDGEKIKCIDLDVALGLSVTSLESGIQNVMQVLNATRAAIMEHHAAKERLQAHTQTEIRAIDRLYTKLTAALKAHTEALSSNINRIQSSQEYGLLTCAKKLSCFLPVLYQHISVSQHLLQNSNKYTFLTHVHKLIGRCALLCETKHPTQPEYVHTTQTDIEAEFTKVLMPLLGLKGSHKKDTHVSSVSTQTTCDLPLATKSQPCIVTKIIPASENSCEMVQLHHVTSCQGASCDTTGCTKAPSADFEGKQKLLQQDLDSVKVKLQELQRDFTQRHCLSRQSTINAVYKMCQHVDEESGQHLEGLKQHQIQLDKIWAEKMQQLSTEKAQNKDYLEKANKICKESRQLQAFATQLLPFIQSITDVAERIAPELEESKRNAEQKDQMSALLHQINTIHPDSGHRIDAIKTVEEERQTQLANRVNPLDDELRKTKGMLKSPSLRQRRGSTPKRDSTSSKPSKDIKDTVSLDGHMAESQEEVSPEDHSRNKETHSDGNLEQNIQGLPSGDKLDNHNMSCDQSMNLNECFSEETSVLNNSEIPCVGSGRENVSANKGATASSGASDGAAGDIQVIAKFKANQGKRINKRRSLEKRNSWCADSQKDKKNVNVKAADSTDGPWKRGSSHEPELETARERLLHDIKTFENSTLQKVSKSLSKSNKK